ncbi:MAG TPA: hypothetical protein VGB64_15830 [Actinomycetota bacterium]
MRDRGQEGVLHLVERLQPADRFMLAIEGVAKLLFGALPVCDVADDAHNRRIVLRAEDLHRHLQVDPRPVFANQGRLVVLDHRSAVHALRPALGEPLQFVWWGERGERRHGHQLVQ